MLFWLKSFFSNRAYHIRAFEEVLVVSVVSIVPLGLLPFIASIGETVDTDVTNLINKSRQHRTGMP